MPKAFDKLIIPLILLCLVKTLYAPSPIMTILTIVFVLTYIQDKYIKNISINNAISFFSAGITLIASYMTSNPLFNTLLSLYSFTLIAIMVSKVRKYNNNIKD